MSICSTVTSSPHHEETNCPNHLPAKRKRIKLIYVAAMRSHLTVSSCCTYWVSRTCSWSEAIVDACSKEKVTSCRRSASHGSGRCRGPSCDTGMAIVAHSRRRLLLHICRHLRRRHHNSSVYIKSQKSSEHLSADDSVRWCITTCIDRKSTRLNSSHVRTSRMPSSA